MEKSIDGFRVWTDVRSLRFPDGKDGKSIADSPGNRHGGSPPSSVRSGSLRDEARRTFERGLAGVATNDVKITMWQIKLADLRGDRADRLDGRTQRQQKDYCANAGRDIVYGRSLDVPLAYLPDGRMRVIYEFVSPTITEGCGFLGDCCEEGSRKGVIEFELDDFTSPWTEHPASTVLLNIAFTHPPEVATVVRSFVDEVEESKVFGAVGGPAKYGGGRGSVPLGFRVMTEIDRSNPELVAANSGHCLADLPDAMHQVRAMSWRLPPRKREPCVDSGRIARAPKMQGNVSIGVDMRDGPSSMAVSCREWTR